MSTTPRRVIVVGAASGIGAATARHLHEHGDHVLAVDVRPNDVPAAEYRQCDLRDPASIADLLDSVGEGWDALAHVAGIPGTAPAADVLKVNYLGLRLMIEGMLPRINRGGAVVAVASTAALGWETRIGELEPLLGATTPEAVEAWTETQDPGMSYYNSKQAVLVYTKRIAISALQNYGVRVNTVSPGPVETPLLPDFVQSIGAAALDHAKTTVGRHASVEDIAPVISFLASPEAGWINAQNIQVDGGYIGSMIAGQAIAV